MLNRSLSLLFLSLVLAAGTEASVPGEGTPTPPTTSGGERETSARGAAVEMHLPSDQTFTPWLHTPTPWEEEQVYIMEKQQVTEKNVKTIKLDNLVPPIRFRQGAAEIPEEYIATLREVLHGMRDRANVRLHFVGHTDALPLSAALKERYADNTGLSRERAGTTAEYFQQALGLPPEAISYEGLGESQPISSNATEPGRALNRRVEVQVWYDEITEHLVEKIVTVPREVSRIEVCRSETVCKLRYQEGHARRARIKNLIAPLHYEEGLLTVTEAFAQQVRQALTNLGPKPNVVVKFIAYSDNAPLAERDERIYGNQLGLSKAVARRVALAIQDTLGLPNTAVESEGKGSVNAVATNDTEQGRAMNRRIEVEFWHDDALQELPDEPQLCPEAAGAELVTRVYASPSGSIEPILFANGQPVIPAGAAEQLRQSMEEIKEKTNVRLRLIGYASNQRLERRTAVIYGDDIGLSTARARRTMEALRDQMGLAETQLEFEGHGYVQSDDVVNNGFIESDSSRVEVQVVYDELVVLDDYEGVDILRLTRKVVTENPFGLNLMRITVDGQPLDDPGKSIPDVQRCTDVALEKAQIEFKYDNLKLEPRLNVTAWPRVIRYQDLEKTAFAENLVQFRLYTNYRSFIVRAEVRIFAEAQSDRAAPLAVIKLNADGLGQWQPSFDSYTAPGQELKYLVRVYDAQGHFDETTAQPLWVRDAIDPASIAAQPREELLVGYGESRLANRNIPLHGGTIQAYGSAIPAEHGVWLAGQSVPVDAKGNFVAEAILPDGLHTVEVAVLNPAGTGQLFLRDLTLKKSDWFYVGMADLTASANHTDGPARLLAPDQAAYRDDTDLTGRLAFYTKGKFGDGWRLTASADTREGPLNEIFSNFLDKSPEALFRRIDPSDHMPTYGDDSTVAEDAPTLGKFYLRLQKDNNYGLWGNFKIGYLDNTLAQVDRGLYGANLHYQTGAATSFGEERLLLDGFAAEPGTVGGRDEFRGTSGSLYFLRRQDVLEGSERVRIEIRDKDSGMVLSVKNLTPALDYSIDYLQGRILLSQPLPATADDSLLVQSDALSGNPVFLVARYEFTPSVNELDKLATGGRIHYWVNDHLKVGLTASNEEDVAGATDLKAADVTLRKSAESWIKLEAGRSEGAGVLTTTSRDGGFDFNPPDPLDGTQAQGYRLDTSVGLKDFFEHGRGQFTLYHQSLEAGYAAPGQATDQDQTQYGGTATLPLSDHVGLRLKADQLIQRNRPETQAGGLETQSAEVNLDYQVDEHWTVSSGVRHDRREETATAPESAATAEQGERTDLVARLLYDSQARWSSYGFVQESLHTTQDRQANGRVGTGGSYRVTDRFNLTGEVSDGKLGESGRLGTEYLYSDRTTLYLNYTLENERTDNGLRARQGNLASGFRTRYSDSASIYLEERYTHGDVPTGLMHSTGVDLAPTDRLNLGANLDFGTLHDFRTGAELTRSAAGVSAGYGFDRLKLASALEYRVDESAQPGASSSKRTSWLWKNSLKYQLSPDWRLLGNFNYAQSKSSLGKAFAGDYTEAVLGYAYRPVHFDRLNALFKYTYFYDVPAPEQSIGMESSSATSPLSGAIQRSQIGAVDVMYDLSPRWTVGGKYAYRLGEVSLDREAPKFFTSRAHLSVARLDWHFLHQWDALAEARRLDLPDAHEQRSGALFALYRQLGNHIKAGVGYNFSDFSDDLTELDYRHQGLFINIIGTL